MNTRLKTIVLLFVSILGLSIVIPDQTMASSNASNLFCYGSTCSGKWPDVEGCSSGASTVMTAPGSGPSGTIEAQLRWSSACNANWARAQSYSGNRYMKAELYTNGYQSNLNFGIDVFTEMESASYYHCADGHMDTNPDPEYDTSTSYGACY